MTSPSAFVFDIGNVLLFFDFRIFVRRIAADCEVPLAALHERLVKPAHDLEARSLPTKDFLEIAFTAIGYRGTQDAFIQAWQEIFTPNEPVIRYAESLEREGHRLYLLSNTNQMHADYFLSRYPVFQHFEGHVFSHEEGCAKPEARIYDIAIDRFNLPPEETVYIDDKPENVTAGHAAGLLAIEYNGPGFDLPAAVESAWTRR